MSDDRLRRLSVLAATLLVLRFGVVPWIGWQREQRDALVVLTKRLDRSAGVIENRTAIEKSSKDLEAALAAYRAKFREAETIESFRLAAQQDLNALVVKNGLRVNVFDWVVEKFDDPPPIARTRARVQIGGTLRALAVIHGNIETLFPSAIVREVRIDPISPTNNPSSTAAQLTLVLDIYFRRTEWGKP